MQGLFDTAKLSRIGQGNRRRKSPLLATGSVNELLTARAASVTFPADRNADPRRREPSTIEDPGGTASRRRGERSPRPRRADRAGSRTGRRYSDHLILILLTLGGAMDAAITSGPQHMLALERANRVRLARAALKRKIAAGRVDAAEVVLSCPWEVESMSVSELLMSQKRWGRTRCRKFLQSIGLLENKTVGSLTERQRVTLAALLTAKAQTSRAAQPQQRPARVRRPLARAQSLSSADVQRDRARAAEAEEPDEEAHHRHDGARDQHELERRRLAFGRRRAPPGARRACGSARRARRRAAAIVSSIPIIIAPTAVASELDGLQLRADPEPADRHPDPQHEAADEHDHDQQRRALGRRAAALRGRPHHRNPSPPERRLNTSRKA